MLKSIDLCVLTAREGKKNTMKHNLLCHGFNIASRSFCVTIRSLVCRSQTSLTTLVTREQEVRNSSCCLGTLWVVRYMAEIFVFHLCRDMRYGNIDVEASDTFLMSCAQASLGNENFRLYNIHHVETSLFNFEL